MPSTSTISIDPHLRALLAHSPIVRVGATWHLNLNMQLSRKDYIALDAVLRYAGGRWDRYAKAHIFPEDPREVLLGAATTGNVVDLKKLHQAYYTPDDLADQLVAAAEVDSSHRILEPSCGDGALARAIFRQVGYWPDCVDNDPRAIKAVAQIGVPRVWEADFLEWAKTTGACYDRILMNPPFAEGQDIVHVRAALRLLKPGGVLAAIMSPHWTFAQDKQSQAFRAVMLRPAEHAQRATWELHPSGSFKESGTAVQTGQLVYRKPTQDLVPRSAQLTIPIRPRVFPKKSSIPSRPL